MHGSIRFSSTAGLGTTFTIELPTAAPPAAAVQESPKDIAAVLQSESLSALPRILHVEDDLDFSSIIAAALSGRAQIVRTDSVEQAQDCLRSGRLSLLLLDPGLPSGSGLELLRVLEREHLNIPVIVLSASELTVESSANIHAVLVKSRTSEGRVVQIILDALGLQQS
jgi:CheY-like chemotaxis protein